MGSGPVTNQITLTTTNSNGCPMDTIVCEQYDTDFEIYSTALNPPISDCATGGITIGPPDTVSISVDVAAATAAY